MHRRERNLLSLYFGDKLVCSLSFAAAAHFDICEYRIYTGMDFFSLFGDNRHKRGDIHSCRVRRMDAWRPPQALSGTLEPLTLGLSSIRPSSDRSTDSNATLKFSFFSLALHLSTPRYRLRAKYLLRLRGRRWDAVRPSPRCKCGSGALQHMLDCIHTL